MRDDEINDVIDLYQKFKEENKGLLARNSELMKKVKSLKRSEKILRFIILIATILIVALCMI